MTIAGTTLQAYTAYRSGSKIEYWLWQEFSQPRIHYDNYAVYSRVGLWNEDRFPVMYWTHD